MILPRRADNGFRKCRANTDKRLDKLYPTARLALQENPVPLSKRRIYKEILLGRGFFVENLRQTAFLARGRLFVKDVALDRFVQ